eukprot:365433-Chlamydomonas_euryale.AAC.12
MRGLLAAHCPYVRPERLTPRECVAGCAAPRVCPPAARCRACAGECGVWSVWRDDVCIAAAVAAAGFAAARGALVWGADAPVTAQHCPTVWTVWTQAFGKDHPAFGKRLTPAIRRKQAWPQ